MANFKIVGGGGGILSTKLNENGERSLYLDDKEIGNKEEILKSIKDNIISIVPVISLMSITFYVTRSDYIQCYGYARGNVESSINFIKYINNNSNNSYYNILTTDYYKLDNRTYLGRHDETIADITFTDTLYNTSSDHHLNQNSGSVTKNFYRAEYMLAYNTLPDEEIKSIIEANNTGSTD